MERINNRIDNSFGFEKHYIRGKAKMQTRVGSLELAVMMAMVAATWLLAGLGLYLAVGFLFALAFVFRGAKKIDPQAKEGSIGFRVLILPGAMALWPILASSWLRGGPRAERNAHRDLAGRSPGT